MGMIRHLCEARERKASSIEINYTKLDEYGMVGDIHYRTKKSSVSMLPYARVAEYFQELKEPLRPGRFGENLLVEGVEWEKLQVGDQLITEDVLLEIERIDAACPASLAYDGYMVCTPMEPYFVFCKVLRGGSIRKDQEIHVLSRNLVTDGDKTLGRS